MKQTLSAILILALFAAPLPAAAQDQPPTQYTPGRKDINVKTVPTSQYDPYYLQEEVNYETPRLSRDKEKEIARLREACTMNKDADACFESGKILETSIPVRAVQYLRLGCKLGHQGCCKEYSALNSRKTMRRASSRSPVRGRTPAQQVRGPSMQRSKTTGTLPSGDGAPPYEDGGMDKVEQELEALKGTLGTDGSVFSDKDVEFLSEYIRESRQDRGLISLKNNEVINGIAFPAGSDVSLSNNKVVYVTNAAPVELYHTMIPVSTSFRFNPRSGTLREIVPLHEFELQGIHIAPDEIIEFFGNGAIKSILTRESKTIAGETFPEGRTIDFEPSGKVKTKKGKYVSRELPDKPGFERTEFKAGTTTQYDADGNLVYSETYDGPTKSYYPDGTLKAESRYDPATGRRENRSYLPDGTLESVTIYQNGKIISQK